MSLAIMINTFLTNLISIKIAVNNPIIIKIDINRTSICSPLILSIHNNYLFALKPFGSEMVSPQ